MTEPWRDRLMDQSQLTHKVARQPHLTRPKGHPTADDQKMPVLRTRADANLTRIKLLHQCAPGVESRGLCDLFRQPGGKNGADVVFGSAAEFFKGHATFMMNGLKNINSASHEKVVSAEPPPASCSAAIEPQALWKPADTSGVISVPVSHPKPGLQLLHRNWSGLTATRRRGLYRG